MPLEIPTPHGPARAHVHRTGEVGGWLVLGHGAGGGVGAPDLVAVTAAAVALGAGVALVEQPYRVAGRRTPPPAARLDAAWLAVVAHLREELIGDRRLVTGGRSSGARVACRTAGATDAAGVLCLAFPLRPPRGGASRQDELDAVPVPVLVVQGERDGFGQPASDPARRREVAVVPGDHGLKRDTEAVAAAASAWLPGVLGL